MKKLIPVTFRFVGLRQLRNLAIFIYFNILLLFCFCYGIHASYGELLEKSNPVMMRARYSVPSKKIDFSEKTAENSKGLLPLKNPGERNLLKYHKFIQKLKRSNLNRREMDIRARFIKETLFVLCHISTVSKKHQDITNAYKMITTCHYSDSLYLIFLEMINTIEKIKFVKTLVPENLLSKEDWEYVENFRNKYTERWKQFETTASDESAYYDLIKEHCFVQILVKGHGGAIEEIKKHVKSVDTIIAPGNTPQYLIELLDDKSFCHKIISLAISGHPGEIKHCEKWINDIITPQGLENYRKYLTEIGFFDKKNYFPNGTTWFIDVISSGGAIRFLIDELKEQEINSSMKFLALNELTETSLPIEGVFLDLGNIALLLDKCKDSLRIMPELSAYKWDDPSNFPKPGEIHTEGARLALKLIRKELKK